MPRLLALAEAAIQRWIDLDPDSAQRLGALDGKLFAVEVRGVAEPLFIRVDAGGLHFTHRAEAEPDVVLRGRPFEFLRAAMTDAQAASGEIGGVQVSGDVDAAQQFAGIIRQLDIDWEEHLSQWLGDLPAHKLGNLARAAREWGQGTRDEMARNAGEYLQEEQRLVTPRWRVEQFLADVDELRAAAERLEQRIERLRRSSRSATSS